MFIGIRNVSITAPTSDDLLTPDDVANILEEILEAQNHSYVVGLKLKLPLHEVEAIHSTYLQPRDRLLRVLIEFTKQVEPKPTWRAIVAPLRNPVVNLPQLAKRLEAAHCPDSTATHATPPEKTQLSHISEIASGPRCQSRISDAAVAHNGMAYFAKEYDIYEFDVSRRYWTRTIPCQQAYFGMAVIEDQLTLIGGIVESEGLEVATNKVACWSLSESKQQSWHERYPALGTARIYPQVVIASKYLIALGGWTELKNVK